jgi:hypothetical protein
VSAAGRLLQKSKIERRRKLVAKVVVFYRNKLGLTRKEATGQAALPERTPQRRANYSTRSGRWDWSIDETPRASAKAEGSTSRPFVRSGVAFR